MYESTLIRCFVNLISKRSREIRKMFAHIRRTVEKKYGNSEPLDDTPSVSWQSISAFCFLRFIVPAVLHPHLFGLCPGAYYIGCRTFYSGLLIP